MRLDWLLNPATFYALASVCLLLSLTLFVSIKLEMAKARCATQGTFTMRESEEQLVRGLETEIQTLRDSVRQLAETPVGRPTGTGLNLTKRAQALRMHHRGEPIPSIAAALETPGNEIALLLKVHALGNPAQK